MSIDKFESPVIWTTDGSILINSKVYWPKRIGMVFLVFRFFLVHGEFHILLHTVLLAIDVSVERSISCICHRILRISPIDFVEFLHQRYEAIHI